MSESDMEFGATDLGGPKNASPSQATTPDANLTNELIRRKVYSRWFALCALAVMMISAVGCLVFSLYVGSHYLNQIDRDTERRIKAEETALVESQKHDVAAPQKNGEPGKNQAKEKAKASTAQSGSIVTAENPYLKFFAPLIPASFSSALAIILFITIARFVTNFERMGSEGKDRDQTEDYGAIAALVQEIGKLIQNLRGKG
ncbi:hypothetical protein [Pseudomonas fluorescens]|nr:hypothetical protein [Pseudomonas fluorescens]MCI4604048.1 hypothetical protein [Pseudomonas fluorescens]TWR47016.1 hypothetical protein FIP59_15265 [Pseudomonas fluorescens]UKJ69208.1 hypothetical protein H1Q68_01480 [Pseudomonas fluorescens]